MQQPPLARAEALDRIRSDAFDVLVIGGGINGAVSAAALSARGARVTLVDRGDFGGFTSQESSNMVWGGFKYLEHYELALVRKLCRSRNRLLAAYPRRIREIGFLAVLDEHSPHSPWLVGAGSAAYWAIGGFRTHRPAIVTPSRLPAVEPVVEPAGVRGAVEYFDAFLPDNDARFVFDFVATAAARGTAVANYVEVVEAEHHAEGWVVTLVDRASGSTSTCRAKVVVNAAGPFADDLTELLGSSTVHRIVHSKGVHLVVPRIGEHERVLAFFDETGRLFYVIPMGTRSVVGTTDTRVADPHTTVTADDVAFLLDQLTDRLRLMRPLTIDDVIARRSGVRPLVVRRGTDPGDGDWTALSRKHAIELDTERSVVAVMGGKLTDCVNVGEEVCAAVTSLGVALGRDDNSWYGEGADPNDDYRRRAAELDLDRARAPGADPPADWLWRRYGPRASAMVAAIADDPSLADELVADADYLRVELRLAAPGEMVTRLDDLLRRRTKIAQLTRADELRAAPGVAEAASLLFGADADARLADYFG